MISAQQPWIICVSVYNAVYINRLAGHFVDTDILAADQLPILMPSQKRIWMQGPQVGLLCKQCDGIEQLIRDFFCGFRLSQQHMQI